MITNDAPVEEQRNETSTSEAGTSLQNQVAIPAANNSAIQVSESSSPEWSSSDEDDGKQVVKPAPQPPNNNGFKVTSTFADCAGVNSTVNNTSIYKDAVTINNNFYCCPSSFNSVLEWYKKRRRTISTTLFVLVILLLLIFLGVWISSFIQSDHSSNVKPEDNSTVSSTEKMSSSTASITRSTAGSPSSTDIISSTAIISTSTDSSNSSTTESPNHEWEIISRDEWGASLPNYQVGKLTLLPPTFVILSETETDGCISTEKCMKIVRDIQASTLKNFLKPDLVYSFLVGGDGKVYEGRGWDVHAVGDYDTEYFNHISISVSFIGTFEDVSPSETILRAAKTLLEFGVKTGKLSEDYNLKCLRQLSWTSDNPGGKLYNVIKRWERWDNRTVEDLPSEESYG